MADRFDDVRRIVEAAMDLPEADRLDYVASVCAGDPALLGEARALVSGLRKDAFLTPPSIRRPAPGAGDVLGGYRLLRVLGSGGMGTVYEAEQASPRRRVALKVLDRSVRSPDARERFRYEAEVLGALRHPGIAQIYEAGIERGPDQEPVPWFAMEIVVDAQTLSEHLRVADATPARRLALFLDVLAAVQHGHQRGVIHRDLKPDNILVDGRGRAKVIDFGVARVADPEILEATLRTQAGAIVGTLAYMSPEQVEGRETDTRSDVYALGVVLYELLTEALPIEVHKSDFLTSARRIVETSPRRPRALRPEMDRDLEAILLKALRKEPEARYESAGALAGDLRRHLAGEPVAARAAGALHQLRLFARRHRVLVAAAATVLLVTLAAAVVSVRFALRSRQAETLARSEQVHFEQLYRAQFMQNVEGVVRDAAETSELYGGGPIALRMTRDAIARLETLQATARGKPGFRVELAEAYQALARSLTGLPSAAVNARGETERAGERALALVDDLLEAEPGSLRGHAARASILTSLAQMRMAYGEVDRAEARVRAAKGALEAAGSPPDVASYFHYIAAMVAYVREDFAGALEHLAHPLRPAAAEVGAPLVRSNRAAALSLRADVLRKMRRFEEAEADLLQADALNEALVHEHPERAKYRRQRARTWLSLAYVLMALGKRDGLVAHYQRAHEELATLHRQSPDDLATARDYGLALRGLGQVATTRAVHDHPRGSPERIAGLREALAHYEQAVEVLEAVQALRPDSAPVRAELALLRQMAEATERAASGLGHPPASPRK